MPDKSPEHKEALAKMGLIIGVLTLSLFRTLVELGAKSGGDGQWLSDLEDKFVLEAKRSTISENVPVEVEAKAVTQCIDLIRRIVSDARSEM